MTQRALNGWGWVFMGLAIFNAILAAALLSPLPILPVLLFGFIACGIWGVRDSRRVHVEPYVPVKVSETVTESEFLLDDRTGEIIERPVKRRVVHFE